ncbi:hypothetical protein V1520DRAFT_391786 [Lipomyces starkeyi]
MAGSLQQTLKLEVATGASHLSTRLHFKSIATRAGRATKHESTARFFHRNSLLTLGDGNQKLGHACQLCGTAGQGRTQRANIELFLTLFGKKFPSPILVSPIRVQSTAHPQAEVASARAAAKLNVPFILSTASSTNMETVAEAHAAASECVDSTEFAKPDRWYQLYWPKDDKLTVSLLRRAEVSGFSVLVVTLDTFSLGFRPADLDQSYLPFIWAEGCAIGFSDPEFNENISLFSLAWIAEVFSGTHKTWEDLKLLRDSWNGPIVFKGIQSVEDAHLAINQGMNVIVVSNQVRKSDLTIIFDSGIRTGSDILKALTLGAQAVLIGRPYIYGLALGGQEGVEHVLKCLLADADITYKFGPQEYCGT